MKQMFDDDLGEKQLGETLRVAASISQSGESVDPSSVTVTIKAPDRSTVVDSQAMTNDDTGSYYYDYDIPADSGMVGVYSGKVTATGSTGRVTIRTFKVDVVKSV